MTQFYELYREMVTAEHAVSKKVFSQTVFRCVDLGFGQPPNDQCDTWHKKPANDDEVKQQADHLKHAIYMIHQKKDIQTRPPSQWLISLDKMEV